MKISNALKRNTFLLVFIFAFIVYGVSAGLKIREQSKTPQYVYLANSFLHGRTNLLDLPKSTYDLISFKEKWYVPGGVTPALLLLPFVAIFGKTFSDVLFGVFIGALNVAMMYSLLGRLVEKPSIRYWLTSLFAFGTVHWWLASMGSVWFNAQLVALLIHDPICSGCDSKQALAGRAVAGTRIPLAPPDHIFGIILFITHSFARTRHPAYSKKTNPFWINADRKYGDYAHL